MLSDGHKDGSSKPVILRLLKYLHEQCDFDVLLFETNMYDATLFQNEIKNQPDSFYSFAKQHIISFISKCSQSKKMFDYAQQSLKKIHPLVMDGFDYDPANDKNFSRQFIYQLDSVLKSNEPGYTVSVNYNYFLKAIDSLFQNKNYFQSSSTFYLNFTRELADTICGKLQRVKNDNNGYWALTGRNLRREFYNATLIGKHPYEAETYREEGMWDDLQWLLTKKYPGKKIIIWAAGTHLNDNTKFDKNMEEKSPPTCGYFLRNSQWKDSVAFFPCQHISAKEENGSIGFDLNAENAKDGLLIFSLMNPKERKRMSRYRYNSKWITGKVVDLSEGIIIVNGDDECGWE
jgi:hypothetical protein